jgi:exopolysaccharide biosynthesis polyprenyl glycosylphosphotransferase
MALNVDTLKITERISTLPSFLVVPSFDAFSLTISAVAGWRFGGGAGVPFAIAAFLLLQASWHRDRIAQRMMDDIASIVGRLAVALGVAVTISAPDKRVSSLLPWAALSFGLVLTGRGVAYRVLASARARGAAAEPTLIVGAGVLGVTLAATLSEHPEFGLMPMGFVDSIPSTGDLPLPLLGEPADLPNLVRQSGIRRVIVAYGAAAEHELVSALRACDELPVEVHVLPRFFELGVTDAPVEDVWGIPLVRLRRAALRSPAWRLKRTFDLGLAWSAVLLSAPLMLVMALLVKTTSRGPILFRQKRVGQNGEVIQLLKFRTMLTNEDSETTWTVDDDDRRTLVGRFLRRTHLDELPQLFNVIRGDMSLVGPRPERPYFVDRFNTEISRYSDRHRVPPGMTGWAQVHGLSGDTSIDERARFDNHYVEHWSLWRDLVILLRTFRQLW